MHKLHLNDEEFRQLALACYLANWIANANDLPGDQQCPGIEAIMQKVYKEAKSHSVNGLKITSFDGQYSCAEHDSLDANEASRIIEDYDNFTLHVGLAHELADVDIHRSVHAGRLSTEEEILTETERKVKMYLEEFVEYGLERLTIDETQSSIHELKDS